MRLTRTSAAIRRDYSLTHDRVHSSAAETAPEPDDRVQPITPRHQHATEGDTLLPRSTSGRPGDSGCVPGAADFGACTTSAPVPAPPAHRADGGCPRLPRACGSAPARDPRPPAPAPDRVAADPRRHAFRRRRPSPQPQSNSKPRPVSTPASTVDTGAGTRSRRRDRSCVPSRSAARRAPRRPRSRHRGATRRRALARRRARASAWATSSSSSDTAGRARSHRCARRTARDGRRQPQPRRDRSRRSSRCSPRRMPARLGALPTHRDGTRIEVTVADPLTENLDTQLIELLGLAGADQARRTQLTSTRPSTVATRRRPSSATRSACSRPRLRRTQGAAGTAGNDRPDRRRRERAGRQDRERHSRAGRARPRVRRAHRADGRQRPGARPHRRRPARGDVAAGSDGSVARQPDQGHGRHEHRRAPASAGRPDGGRDRRPRSRRPRVDDTDRVRREVRDAHPRQDPRGHRASRARHGAGDVRPLLRPHPVAVRHGDLRRTDRLGQDHDALRDAQRDQQRRDQRRDDRGPDRVRVPDDQPDPDQRAGGADLRQRPAIDPPPGSRRDPRRRDPRRRDRAHRDAGRAHRSLRHVVVARDRRDLCAAPLHGHGHRVVPDRVVAARRRRPAARSRKVCEHCAEPYVPTPEERSFFERGGGAPDKHDFVAGVGCNFCGHTGYFDRIGIYEVLAGDRRDEGAHRQRRAARGAARARDRAGHDARCATRPSGSSPRTRRRSPRCCAPCTCC